MDQGGDKRDDKAKDPTKDNKWANHKENKKEQGPWLTQQSAAWSTKTQWLIECQALTNMDNLKSFSRRDVENDTSPLSDSRDKPNPKAQIRSDNKC